MGLIDISKDENQGKIYLLYKEFQEQEVGLDLSIICCKEAFKTEVYILKIAKDDSTVKKWSDYFEIKPENYLQQLLTSLRNKSLQNGDENNDSKEVNLRNPYENFFELDGKNLIWRQYFSDKQMFGRKGKFILDKAENINVNELILTSVITELKEKEITIQNLKKSNEKLIAEKNELAAITEESVKMKEDLEKELYGKFVTLLNTKKEKLRKCREELYKLQHGHIDASQSQAELPSLNSGNLVSRNSGPETITPTDQSSKRILVEKSARNEESDNDYADDTDIDDEMDTDDEINNLKRKCVPNYSTRNEYPERIKRQNKYSKAHNLSEIKKSKKDLNDSQNSPDLLNASLEMELNWRAGANR